MLPNPLDIARNRIIFSSILIAALFFFSVRNTIAADCDSLYTANNYVVAIDCYEELIGTDSLSADSYWKLARTLNLQAELEPKDRQLDMYERAAAASRRCLKIDSMLAEGHFQLARALGKIALFKGVFKSASLAKQVKKEAEKCLELDPRHDGAMHLLGRWHREVAQKPKFLRAPMGLGEADKKKGLEFFEKALSLNPTSINHHLEYGISLLDLDMADKARLHFERCLQLEPTRPNDYRYQDSAKEYLAKLGRKD